MSEITLSDPKVEVSEIPQDPENPEWGATEASVYPAKISHDQEGRSAKDIWEVEKEDMDPKKLEQEQRGFLERLAGMGHTSCFYQANVGLNYEIPRHTTMFLCQFDYPKYLQQSQRYTEADDFTTKYDRGKELFENQMDFYKQMVDGGIEKEDARYVLPLATSAKHIHQNTNFVGLANVFRVLESEESKVPSVSSGVMDDTLEKLKDREPILFDRKLIDIYNETGNGYPVANMFSEGNEWVDETLNFLDGFEEVRPFEKDVDLNLFRRAKKLDDQATTFLNLSNNTEEVEGYVSKMSLSAWHQFMRNDTVKQSVESIYDAAERSEIVIPESIEESNYTEDYLDLCGESLKIYEGLSRRYGKDEALEVLPHGMNIGVAFSLDGFNLTKGFMEDRNNEAAQWEIREIARELDENYL
ncbi:MAG: FAD-dependent thymidylate synthase [Candidatus Aenigmatarchaeota archaeon]